MEAKSSRSSLLRSLLAAHPIDRSRESSAVVALLNEASPSDYFSISQWEIGLDYYRKRISDFSLSGDLLVDLGCGTGNWSLAAADSFSQVIGFDNRLDRIAIAEKICGLLGIGNISFKQLDITELSVADNSVDCVIAYNVLPYVPTWEAVMSEAFRVLRSGGKFWCAWAEAGILLFNLAEAIWTKNWGALRDLTAYAYNQVYKFIARSDLNYNGVYLKESIVKQQATRLGFVSLWESRTDGFTKLSDPLLPQRKFGFPFFSEMLFVKE